MKDDLNAAGGRNGCDPRFVCLECGFSEHTPEGWLLHRSGPTSHVRPSSALHQMLVTGAARGMGRGTVIALAARGARHTLKTHNAEELEAVASSIGSSGGKAISFVGDVPERSEIERVVSAVQDRWGRVDILVAKATAYR